MRLGRVLRLTLNSLFGISFVVTGSGGFIVAERGDNALNSLFGISFVVTCDLGDRLHRHVVCFALNSLFGISFVVTSPPEPLLLIGATRRLSIPFLGFLLL